MTKQERQFRQQAVQFAIDNNRLEGMVVDDDAMALFNARVDGKISFDEVKAGIYEICEIGSLH